MRKWIRSVFRELKTDLPIEIGFDLLKDAFKKNVEHTLKTNPREDVMKVLAVMAKSPAVTTIFNRLRVAEQTAEPGYENDVVLALGGVLPRDKDGKVEEDKAKQTYEWVGGLSDEDFAVFVHALEHDPYWQRVKMAWRNAKVGEKLDAAGNIVDDLLTTWTASASRRGKP